MATTYSDLLRLAKQGTGDNNNTWGLVLNDNVFEMIEQAIAEVSEIDLTVGTSDYTLTTNNATTDQARCAVLKFIGSPTATRTVIVPPSDKVYIVHNALTTNFNVILSTDTGNDEVTVPQNRIDIVYTDGADVFSAVGAINQLRSGTGAPSNSLGIDGDFYIDTAGTVLYGPKAAGAWPAGVSLVGPAGLIAGAVLPYAGPSLPSGFLWCNGAAVSRTVYATLFSIVGTTYGAGDGSTTFNLPDLRGRSVFGLDDLGGAAAASRITVGVSGIAGTTLGASGGDQNIPSHTHTASVTDPGHTHLMWPDTSTAGQGALTLAGQIATAGGFVPNNQTFNYSLQYANVTPTIGGTGTATTGVSVTIGSGGSGSSANVPPALMMNWVIKT